MKNILTFYLLLTFVSFGQKTIYKPKIRGEKGEPLIIVDSLSFNEKYLKSEFFVDSITKLPYSGTATVNYGVAYDSLVLIDGVKEGWQFTLFNSPKGCCYIGHSYYYNQQSRIYLSIDINLKNTTKFSNFVRYYEGNSYYFFEVQYKKNNKYKVKQHVTISNQYTKKLYKMKSINELEDFFKKHEKIYELCKKGGFFGQPEINLK